MVPKFCTKLTTIKSNHLCNQFSRTFVFCSSMSTHTRLYEWYLGFQTFYIDHISNWHNTYQRVLCKMLKILILDMIFYKPWAIFTDLSLASYHFVLDLSPKTDLSLFVKWPLVYEHNFLCMLKITQGLTLLDGTCWYFMLCGVDSL